jgi:glycine betaine/choline ABC-type transport system substrate-binding protein
VDSCFHRKPWIPAYAGMTSKEHFQVKRLFLLLVILLTFSNQADACVGKTLHIGAINTVEGQVLSEILSVLIDERTGTTVKIKYYNNREDLYKSIKAGEVDILFEDTVHAMQLLTKPREENLRKAYEVVKEEYKKAFGLIWLEPFGFINGRGNPSYTAPVLKGDILSNFPALPRLINKLAGTISDEAYMKLINSVEKGEKPKKVARDFLKAKKLI